MEWQTDIDPKAKAASWLEAQLDLRPQVDFGVKLGLLHVKTHATLSGAYATEARVKIGYTKQWGKEITLGTVRQSCFDVQAGPVPVILCPEFTVSAKVSLTASSGVTMAVDYKRTVGVELHTDNGSVTANKIDKEDPGNGGSMAAYADGRVRAGLPLAETIYIYGAAGPQVEVEPYVEGFADTPRPVVGGQSWRLGRRRLRDQVVRP